MVSIGTARRFGHLLINDPMTAAPANAPYPSPALASNTLLIAKPLTTAVEVVERLIRPSTAASNTRTEMDTIRR